MTRSGIQGFHLVVLLYLVGILSESTAFVGQLVVGRSRPLLGVKFVKPSPSALLAAGGKKKRRRRKQPPGFVASDPIKTSQEQIEGITEAENVDDEDDGDDITDADILQLEDVANFEFKTSPQITLGKRTLDVKRWVSVGMFSWRGAEQESKMKRLLSEIQMLRFHYLTFGRPVGRKS